MARTRKHTSNRGAATAAPRTSATGRVESLDGWWTVEWDHRDVTGYLTYLVTDLDEGRRYVARHDDGWRIAPEGHATVDMEHLIDPGDPELMTLVVALNTASGRAGLPGVHVWED